MSSYLENLQQKQRKMADLWQAFGAPEAEVYASQPQGYRYRAEFRIWHQDNQAHYAMYRPGTKIPQPIEQFAPACDRIRQAMPLLMQEINCNELLKHRLYTVEFLATLSNELLVTLIYHRPIEQDWDEAARPLQRLLDAQILGRSRKRKRVLDRDYLEECLTTATGNWKYRQYEGSFSQPNAAMACHMIDWVVAQAGKNKTDLLELYCGNGNFTLPLSRCFGKVLATELSKVSIRALEWAIENNGCTNLTCARLSAEELVQAMDGVRPFRRLQEIDLSSYQFSHLLVDPPRAGLDPATRAFAARFEQIICISCSPESLQRDLQQLTQTHEIVATALFDQFPMTDHIENGALLRKRQTVGEKGGC